MNAKFLTGTLLIVLLIFTGCVSTKNYETWTYEGDPNQMVVRMKTYDQESEYFTFRYDTTIWELEEWPAEAPEDSTEAVAPSEEVTPSGESTESAEVAESTQSGSSTDSTESTELTDPAPVDAVTTVAEVAPNRVALVHKEFKEDYSPCVLLPGSIGTNQFDESYAFYEGSMLTTRYVANTLDVFNPAGVHVLHLVGYDVDGLPYIFELKVAAKDADTCQSDAQAVIGSFIVEGDEAESSIVVEETTEEATAEPESTAEVEAIKEEEVAEPIVN